MSYHTKLYDYDLPPSSINQNPYRHPEESSLLIAESKKIIKFENFESIIDQPSLFIFNNSKVRNVRIVTNKISGGSIEVFILNIIDEFSAKCLLKSSDKKIIGKKYNTKNFNFKISDIYEGSYLLNFDISIEKLIDEYGLIPLPPYIKDDQSKYKYYNNVYASGGFSVASPTAGLHFTNDLLNKLNIKNDIIFINLDVNIGTFKPMQVEKLDDHKIHSENYSINKTDFKKIEQAKNKNKPIYTIGTTSLRAVETAFLNNSLYGETDYFIKPDTQIHISDYLLTNFHAPMSSLLSIVHNVYGDNWHDIYDYAIESGLKFLSFGDAVLFKIDE